MLKVDEFRLTALKSTFLNILAGLIFLVGFLILMLIILSDQSLMMAELSMMNNNIVIMFLMVGCLALMHELIHGIAYKLFGGNVKFGMKYLNLYTMDKSGSFYKPVEMVTIMLMPLIILTIAQLLLIGILPQMFFYLSIGIIFNISGSTGDMIMALFLLAKGKGYLIRDESYGFSLHTVQEFNME